MVAKRVLRTTQVVLSRTFTVDEVPTEPAGNVGVTVTRWDGTVVQSGTATPTGSPGVRQWTLTGGLTAPAATWQLDDLTVTWEATLGGSLMRVADGVEVVGGHYFDIADFRSQYPDFKSPARHSGADLARRRVGVETEIEQITWRAFVPRFAVDHVQGTNTQWLGLSHCEISAIRSITTPAGVVWSAGQISALQVTANGMLESPAVWTSGAWTVEYEHGWSSPPLTIVEAAMHRLSLRAGRPNTAIPANAQSYTTEAGAIFRLGQGGKLKTGVADVDSDLAKYTKTRRAATA